MKSVLVRYRVKPDRVDENVELVRAVYAQLQERGRPGLRYCTFRAADGVTFFHLAVMDDVAAENTFADIPAFAAFQANLRERCDEPPAPVNMEEIVGAYGFPWASG